MKEYPLISVILPTHNRAKYIRRAIESAMGQSYSNIELIVINDASTDNTLEIISGMSLNNPKITIVNNERNVGIVVSLNKGIKVAKGKYIARLDDDDIWCDEKKIEKQVAFLENNQDYVLVGGGVIRVNQSGREIIRYFLPKEDEDIRKVILTNNTFVHTSVLFRKDVFDKVGGYDHNFLFVEDWDLWMKMGTVGKFYNFQEFFVRYLDQEYDNPGHYRNRGIRRKIGLNIKLRRKYKDYYTGYGKAILLSFTSYFYSFLPFKKKIWPLTFWLRSIVFGSSPYTYFRSFQENKNH